MREQKGTSGGGVLAIAAVAFVLGRCSAAPEPQARMADQPATLAAPTLQPMAPVGSANSDRRALLPSEASPPTVEKPYTSEPVVDEPEPVAETYYARCADARAAGAAPIRVGDPGYARHLDRDGDGVACE